MTTHTPKGLGPNATRPIHALTHSGNFHTDETLGYVILHHALAPHGDLTARILNAETSDGLALTRTRTPETIAQADIVFDVGGRFDPETGRYDHHMKDKPLRADGTTPYSAAGLLWRDYGTAAIRNILATITDEPHTDEAIAAIWQSVDSALILPVDQDDNGVAKMGRLSLADIVSACNPPWDTAERLGADRIAHAEAHGFATAAALVSTHLQNLVNRVRAAQKSTDRVLSAYASAEDKRILVMDTGMPTEKVIFEHDLPVIYVVSPANNAQWNVKAIPPVRGEFGQRLSLPEAWAGLERETLAHISGVPDAVFAHPARFICGAQSREGALTMARRAIEIGTAKT